MEVKQLTTKLNESNQQIDTLKSASRRSSMDVGETTIVRVCQRIKEEADDDDDDEIGDAMDSEDSYEIWALLEYETAAPENDALSPLNAPSFRRHKEWHKFINESALSDYIRRDTGEPLILPPYSLSPEQSQKMAEDARKAVATISEEFRRFRVRAEVAKKQADATVRALHSNSVQTTRMRIEGQDIVSCYLVLVEYVLFDKLSCMFVMSKVWQISNQLIFCVPFHPPSTMTPTTSHRRVNLLKQKMITPNLLLCALKWLNKKHDGKNHMICYLLKMKN